MLADKDMNFIRLILRSDDVGEGWRTVSAFLTPHFRKQRNPDLVDERTLEDGTYQVRLSTEGLVVGKYL